MHVTCDVFCFFIIAQNLVGLWLSQLMDICRNRNPSPNPKIIKNLCSSACCDADHTPNVIPRKTVERDSSPTAWEWNSGIFSLHHLQKEVSEGEEGEE